MCLANGRNGFKLNGLFFFVGSAVDSDRRAMLYGLTCCAVPPYLVAAMGQALKCLDLGVSCTLQMVSDLGVPKRRRTMHQIRGSIYDDAYVEHIIGMLGRD